MSDARNERPAGIPSGEIQLKDRRPAAVGAARFEALLAFARADFWCFVELMFPVLYPGNQLVYAQYLELIASLLMRVGSGKYRNVIINLPPRHMKSALSSILYTAWRLGSDPTVNSSASVRRRSGPRSLLPDPQGHALGAVPGIFPKTVLDKSAVDHIRTTMGGYRYATAVGSDITGFGADEIIIDDPVQPDDALSERIKQRTRDWVDTSVRTRLNDPSRGAIILIMHRLAPDDLAATMEPDADFVLKLPLVAEKVERFSYEGRDIMVRAPGDPLNPARIDVGEIEALRRRIAPHVFELQYQQHPTACGSGYCSIERLSRYSQAPPFELVVHSWDIAATKGGGDWTVCAKFGLARDAEGRDILYLTGIVRMQVELPDVREAIWGSTASRSQPSSLWTATASAGASIRTSRRRDSATCWRASP